MRRNRRKYKIGKKNLKSSIPFTKPSGTNADVTNRAFIMGDSIGKHIRGYELSRKL